jgi:hypothetical protein
MPTLGPKFTETCEKADVDISIMPNTTPKFLMVFIKLILFCMEKRNSNLQPPKRSAASPGGIETGLELA